MKNVIRRLMALSSFALLLACGGGGGSTQNTTPNVSDNAAIINGSAGTVASTIILVMN